MSKNINRNKNGEPFDTGPHKKPKSHDNEEKERDITNSKGQLKNKVSST